MNLNRWRFRAAAVLCLTLWAPGAALALLDPADIDLLRQQAALKSGLETKIQDDILDPILGKGEAKNFVDLDLEYVTEREDKVKSGAGEAMKYKEKAGAKNAGMTTDYILPGVPKPKFINNPNESPGKPSSASSQFASQEQQKKEQVFALQTNVKRLQVTVIHNDTVSKPLLDVVRSRIVDALSQFKALPDQIVFRPAHFDAHDWHQDLKNPNVYLPLLYAALLLLFLMFLFGPLARFMRRYVDALKEKPAAEVNVESKIEQPEDEEGPGGPDESKLDIMLGRKPPEPPPPVEDEEAMKKFEPFSYINEENLKRLANLFLLRREEPWLIAVVLSYLKPEYMRQILTAFPVELQTKVATEMMMVRQVTREQVVAIDNEVKENIDFVVGGMARLTQMLEEADTQTRQNILETLKNEKPMVYDKVRKLILTFDDVVGFPDRDMQLVVRELKTESMARALQNASPDVVNKFLANMSTGAASLLKESMEYTKGLTPVQIEEERSKIMDLVKAMEKEGKIAVRESAREGGGEGFQEELAIGRGDRFGAPAHAGGAKEPGPKAPEPAPQAGAAPQPNPAAAQQAYQSGLQALETGALDDAVKQLRQALDADPDLWQAHQYLGQCLYQMGRVPEAMIHYEKALEFNQDPQLKAWIDSYKAQVH